MPCYNEHDGLLNSESFLRAEGTSPSVPPWADESKQAQAVSSIVSTASAIIEMAMSQVNGCEWRWRHSVKMFLGQAWRMKRDTAPCIDFTLIRIPLINYYA